jgi:carboxypeptidase T
VTNSDPVLKNAAWSRYRLLQAALNRKQSVPQVMRIFAPVAEVLRAARETKIEVVVWSASGDETVAAVPPFLVERLASAGVRCDVLYDTIADWQKARSAGDSFAVSITPDYQNGLGASRAELRIAVVDLGSRTRPAAGYSDWLADREDILIRDRSTIAVLDRFQSDGSDRSIADHVENRYTRKGYRLIGLFTPAEFAEAAPRLFPGRNFDPGKPSSQAGIFTPQLAEGGFHSYEETLNEFRGLANSHPNIARFVKLGTSYEGRDIFALKITRDPDGEDPNKPDVLVNGCYHAREWISVEAPVFFAGQLVNSYSSDDSIKYLVDNLQFWIVPIINPDGLVFSQQSPNDRIDNARTWRKNRRPVSVGGCVSSIGVDLNRNFDFQWRLPGDSACENLCEANPSCVRDDIGGSDDPRDEVYRGPEPASEPETRALKSLLDDPLRRFRAQLDYHNFSQLILYPWAFDEGTNPDSELLALLAARISSETRSVNNKLYVPEQAIDLYPATGSSTDYAYGVNGVPAPFVVEMRPDCCSFNVPESDILAISRENWAGARPLFDWAAGPPILHSVSAFTTSSDGSLSNLVYAAHWEPTPTGRNLIVDTRLAGIPAGPMRVKLQFSKPMNRLLAPQVTLGRDGRFDEVTFSATAGQGGWQKTLYPNDTWIGEGVVFQDFNPNSAWVLAARAEDQSGMSTDGQPATIAGYTAGTTGRWERFEDSQGQGSAGGTDVSHQLAPTLRDDFPGIFVAAPGTGERLAAGDAATVNWVLAKGESFNPGPQNLFISTDGGTSFSLLAGGLTAGTDKLTFTLPMIATTRARFRIEAIDRINSNSIFGENRGDFTVGVNVGSGVEIKFLSSEKTDLSWSAPDPNGTPLSGASRLAINLSVTNHATVSVLNPFLRVSVLQRNVLLSRDPRSTSGAAGRQSIDAGPDSVLAPGETVSVRVVVGLTGAKKFKFSVGLFGVPESESVGPAQATQIWKGKPKTK